jgi:guanylate kinase
MSNNILVTVTGPSLTGKSKLAQLLAPYGFEELVSTTTRPQRTGEVDGVHYNFVDVPTFEKMIKDDLMIEHAPVGSNYYGVSKPAFDNVISKGKNGIAVVEPDGAQEIAKYCTKNNINLHQVFLDNPTQILIERFLKRYKEDQLANDATYARRIIDMLQVEPKEWIEPAYSGKHYYDQVFESFLPNNEADVVKEVLTAVESKLAKKTKRKP